MGDSLNMKKCKLGLAQAAKTFQPISADIKKSCEAAKHEGTKDSRDDRSNKPADGYKKQDWSIKTLLKEYNDSVNTLVRLRHQPKVSSDKGAGQGRPSQK